MKRITAIAIFVLAGFVTINSASAQEHVVHATVPFNFAVNGKVLPAGSYTITQVNSGTIEIESRTMHIAALSRPFYDSRELGGGGKLVFNKYGDQYFLKEVICPYSGMTQILPASKPEKKARATQEAKLHGNDQVLVAAK